MRLRPRARPKTDVPRPLHLPQLRLRVGHNATDVEERRIPRVHPIQRQTSLMVVLFTSHWRSGLDVTRHFPDVKALTIACRI